ncbi:MAG: hypothetical protein HY252_14165 [Sphingobacteriales bacterium]|nr:hypothetical protein [Sphingobacteriales bacterium]
MVTAPPNFETLKQSAADSKNLSEFKNKFAETIDVNYDVIKLAKAFRVGNNIVYSIKFSVDKALNLSFQFSEFKLSPNTVLSIFTNFELTDSITSKEDNPSNIWATRIYQGNELYFKLSVPSNEAPEVKLRVKKMSLGYRHVGGGFFGNPGTSGNCNINVVCPPGAGWENERNSVALIVSGGNEICTGTLVMNTCGTNRPYLLTANHCLNSNVTNWVFQFQTWSSDCATNTGWREDVQFNGCQLRANNAATDFALVELNQIPATNSGITYSGWSRTGNLPVMTTSIHHPSGDLMKISHDFQAPVSVSWFNGANNHWRATFDQGIVQHGSSGSALFDENHRLIGQLHGNQNNICNIGDNNCFCNIQLPSIGEYGRFDISWTGGGTNSTRLSNWLDYAGTNALTTNTTNISALPNTITPAGTIIGHYTVNGGSTQYSITNDTYQNLYVPRNSWVSIVFTITTQTFPINTWSFENITANGLNFTAGFQSSPYGYGSVYKNIYLDAGTNCGTIRRTYSFNVVSIGGFGRVAVSPNPTKDVLNVSITKTDSPSEANSNAVNNTKILGRTNFAIADINTNQVLKRWTFNESKLMNYNLDIRGLKAGVYILTTERNGETATTKVIIQ